MSVEEDLEVILEGGELHKYLSMHNENIDEVFSRQQELPPEISVEVFSSAIIVSDEIVSIVDRILKSNLLLDEDASFLFKKLSELVPEAQSRLSYKLFLPGIVIMISAYWNWNFNKFRKFCSAFMACSAIFLVSEIARQVSHRNHIENIEELLLNLKNISSYIRKNIKMVQEEDSLIYSQERVLQMRNNVNLINKYTLSRKKFEIFIICERLISILKTSILLSRNFTLAILKNQKYKSLSGSVAFISLYSDEELGINKYNEEVDKETSIMPFIDTLRNVFIMLQSESLRELGLCLCRFTKNEEIESLADIIYHYKSKSSNIVLELKKMHEKHFYPSYIPKKVKPVSKNVRFLSNAIHSISTKLNSLVIDSRNLETFMDDNIDGIGIDTSQNIGLKLLQMERETAYLADHIHLSAQQFLKQSNYFNQNTPNHTPIINDKVVKTECTVGTSDFSISGQDEVFLGHVEGTESTRNDSDYITEYGKPTYHHSLINELKSALLTKREDFEKREIKALKSHKEIENYKSCTSEISRISIESKTESNSMLDQCASMSKTELSEEVRGEISIEKDLAKKAADFFKSWNKANAEECFGEDTDDEFCVL